MMKRQIFPVTVFLLLVCLAVSSAWAGSSGVSISKTVSGVSGVRVGGSSSFRPAAGASSYGNLYRAPQGGGALSSSISKINQRSSFAGRSGTPASAFGGTTIRPSGSSTKNIAAGALRSPNLNNPPLMTPAAGGPAPLLTGAGAAPSPTKDTSQTAILTSETDFASAFSVSAEDSGRAYAAIFAPSQTKAGNEEDVEPLKTLVPKRGGSRRYRQLIREGEEAFRKQDYKKASQAFAIAYEISSGSSESMLSLLHVYFATARNGYNIPSHYLQRVLKDVPELPLIPVHPRDFYGNVGVFVEDVIRLEEYAKTKPKDANAQLILAYMKWREKKPNQTAAALRRAMENCKQNDELSDAIRTFWKAMVHSGVVSGKLEEVSTSGEINLSPSVSPTTDNPLLLPQ